MRPPGFEPGFLPYGCRSEAVRLALAGLRRADARVPVLDQTVPTLLPSRALFGSLRKVCGRLDYGRTESRKTFQPLKRYCYASSAVGFVRSSDEPLGFSQLQVAVRASGLVL